MKSLILKMSIALGASLLFATQASAYDINTLVSPTGNAWEWGNNTAWNTWTYDYANGSSSRANYTGSAIYIKPSSYSSTTEQGSIFITSSIRSSNSITFKKGYYYTTSISFAIASPEGVPVEMTEVERITVPDNAPYKFVNMNILGNQCFEVYEGRLYNPVSGSSWVRQLGSQSCKYGAVTFVMTFQAIRDDTGTFQIGNGSAWTFRNALWWADPNKTYGTINVQTITEYKPDNISSINDQQQEAGEQAQQDGNTASNQAQSDATSTGTSLISGASNIIGALTDTTAGTCNINMNMGILDLGTQNFCQGDIGPIRPIIATITNVLFAFVSLRVFIFLIGVMFGLFDQFLGTKTETGGTNG